ncbi:MAG: hypothetical protein VZR27_10705 [Acutalibacteraceae bacterium]|nr:hypothetical protein [Acutalibacteraceae bacterium]
MSYNTLEPADIQALREYQKASDELAKREPERLPHEIWDKLLPQIQATGEVPPEYRGIIGIYEFQEPKHHYEGDRLIFDEGEQTSIGYYDIEWERWNEELGTLHTKYHDAITKALRYALSNDIDGEESLSTVELIELLTDKVMSNFSFEETTEPRKANPRNKAIETGALMSIDGHIATFTADDLKNALNICSIFRLPAKIDRTRAFDENGKLDSFVMRQAEPEELTKIHIGFLMAILQATLATNDENNIITFYLPEICRELKIDPRTYSSKRDDNSGISYAEMRFNRMLEIILPFDSLIGRTPDGSYHRVLAFQKYDKESETMTVTAPYFYRLKEIVMQRMTDTNNRQLHQLFHSDVANEPNYAAVELAARILRGIVIRGVRADYKTYSVEPKKVKQTITQTDSDGTRTTKTTVFSNDENIDITPKSRTVTYRVKYSTLIHECPQFERELEEIERAATDGKIKYPTQAYNKKLRDVFSAAFRIIEEKSDAPLKYLDFTLPTTQRTIKGKKTICYDVPTKSTLNRFMIITHKGQRQTLTE